MTTARVRWSAANGVAALVAACASACAAQNEAPPKTVNLQKIESFTEAIPGSTVKFDMIQIPPGDFWMSKTEVTWDAYDLFVYGTNDTDPNRRPAIAGVTYPSKPYISMDRSFGHSGFAAISVSFRGAETFCKWLSAKTGKHYRLPTEAEWRRACAANPNTTNEDATIPGAETLMKQAWLKETAGGTTHAIATKEPNAFGLYDMIGNACEWAVGDGGRPVALGGAYFHSASDLIQQFRMTPKPAWNASDPQLPKSVWWLADGGFVGFRIVCEKK
ncbi:MAG: formylglycine-generating enzyme family protein [Planctomycetota bacterium]